MKYQLLKIIVCPMCHTHLFYDKNRKILVCVLENLFFPIKQGIPVLLEKEACRFLKSNRKV